MNRIRSIITLALFATVALGLTGCGPSSTTVQGKVSYKGKPVVWGSVTIVASDGSVHQAGIDTDGTYTIPKVPLGGSKVGVESSAPPTPGASRGDARGSVAPPPPPPGAWFAIPVSLSDPKTSGVTLDIRSGQSADIDLK